jgi:hypothetical protein
MKKFKEGDIFYNTIRCYPKVEFFANAGQVHYNKQNHPAITSRIPIESVGLFELLNPVPIDLSGGGVPNNSLLTEGGDSLITEGGDFILIES